MSKYSTICFCRSCKSKNLVNILSLGNLYLSDFVTDNRKPEKYPLTLVLCKDCTLLQLKNTTPQRLLYTENYGYKSGINQTMKNELKDIAEKSISRLNFFDRKIVAVDIGANDGTLLGYYPSEVVKIGIEPIKKFALECKKFADIVINDFFSYEAYVKHLGGKKVDIVTAISCFYDMEDPNKIIGDVKKIMKKDGIFVVQQNYLVKMLLQNAFDNIVHEHLEYYSLLSMQHLLKRHGLEVFDLELRQLNGGSFRTYIGFQGVHTVSSVVYEQEQLENIINLQRKKIYLDFSKRIKEIKHQVYSFIRQEVEKGKKIYIYGASTRGNTLIQYFGLNSKLIPYAVERNPEKWGKKIASLGIPIISEEQAREQKPDYMFVLPWFFKEEFLKREKNYLASGGHFIFPLPYFEVI
jgi:SAM-dependent methyltransferase